MFVLLDMFKGKFWDEVYIYFKLMIIDDVFVMYGLVNVNLCSMEVDSELNVCYELMWVIQLLWEKLWWIYVGDKGLGMKDKNG